MREIKFRAKRVDSKQWVYVFYFYSSRYGAHFIKHSKDLDKGEFIEYDIEIIPETVGQFTGLQDKNGVDIFEKDLVEQKRVNGKTITGVIVYNPKTVGFEIEVKNDNNYGFYSAVGTKCVDVEVIENINKIEQ